MSLALIILAVFAAGCFVGYIVRDIFAVIEASRAYVNGRAEGFELGQAAALAPLDELHKALNRW